MRAGLLLPSGFADRPTGGNVYARRLRRGLLDLGWDVVTREVSAGEEPVLDAPVVLVDSLVASWCAPDLLPSADRVVPLVHMAFGTPGEGELLAAAPAVVATSAWSRQDLVDRHALDPDRVHVAEPGADAGEVAPGTCDGGELLCVAAVVPDKGHDVLLAALATLTDLAWRCTLVGPLDRDPGYVDRLRASVEEAGLADRVRFAGPVAHERLGSSYAAADLLVHPSRHETYGMVVTEALAHGLPVVASAVGGVPEALAGAGLLVPPGDPDALATALREWLEDVELRTRLRRSALARRSALPTWSHAAEVVAAVLDRVSGGRGGPVPPATLPGLLAGGGRRG